MARPPWPGTGAGATWTPEQVTTRTAKFDLSLWLGDRPGGPRGYWEYNTDSEIWSSPYYADGKIYLGTDAAVVWVFQHGKEFKKPIENDMAVNNKGGRVRATPIAANGVLYVMTENKLYAIK